MKAETTKPDGDKMKRRSYVNKNGGHDTTSTEPNPKGVT